MIGQLVECTGGFREEPQQELRKDPGTPVKVLYVGGLGRSGSTLLDRMLGELPAFFSAGEVRDVWLRCVVENRLCGCGVPFRECAFWQAVADQAFGGWDALNLERVLAVARSIDRHRHVPAMLAPVAFPRFQRRLAEHAAVLERLYRAIASVSRARVIVDSSKAPSYACLLRRVPGIDLRVVHLVRDSRGTAFSWHKRVERPDVVGRSAHMARYHPARIAVRWLTRNGLMHLLRRLGVPTLFMRYEALVAAPREHVAAAARLAGSAPTTDDLGYLQDGEASLHLGHSVQGNPMRMASGLIPLRLDEQWRRSMRPRHRALVTAVTLPLLRRYGYR